MRHFISAGISGDKAKEYTNNIIKDLSESEVLNLEYINYLGLENTDGLKFFKYLKNRQPAPIKPKLEAIKDRIKFFYATKFHSRGKYILYSSVHFCKKNTTDRLVVYPCRISSQRGQNPFILQ